jgi:2-polyprenyl-3-methyl-5-hydroxy-6-metoxy-1,4-benzoquinol methylase
MRNEREAWNQRYRERSHSSRRVDPFLIYAYENYIQPLFPRAGAAIDLAGGVGRHANWLAQRNWRVTLVDISEEALQEAQRNAGVVSDRIEFRQEDLVNFKAGRTRFEVVLVFFYLERRMFAEIFKSLGRGGLLVFKTYTREQRKFAGGPSHPLHLLKENELLHAFPELRVLFYRETIRDRGIAEFVGRKMR